MRETGKSAVDSARQQRHSPPSASSLFRPRRLGRKPKVGGVFWCASLVACQLAVLGSGVDYEIRSRFVCPCGFRQSLGKEDEIIAVRVEIGNGRGLRVAELSIEPVRRLVARQPRRFNDDNSSAEVADR